MKSRLAVTIAVLTLAAAMPTNARAGDSNDDGPGFFHRVLFYIPNRALDLVDIVRLRGRVGPGLAAGVRATTAADAYLGSYTSVYAGLPGPRMRPIPKLPAGLETMTGAGVSVADATIDSGFGPDYSPTEFGISLHPVIVGIDAGFDPVEILDFALGLLTIDLRDDDF